jgi:hypothetical protein
MTDYRKLLEAIYGNLGKLYGLIKDNEQDLHIVDKADSLMEDTKTDLLYLNDCIYRYVSNARYVDQYTDAMFSDISKTPNASVSPLDGGARHNQQQNVKQPLPTNDPDDEIL